MPGTLAADGTREFDIERARSETPGCANVVHLNNAGAALMPQPVIDRMMEHLSLEAAVGGYEAAERVEEDLDRVYQSAAVLLGCRPDEIAIMDNASRAWAAVVQSVPLRAGDRVVVGVAEYVSNCLVLDFVCQQTGAELTVVPNNDDGQIDLDVLRAVADERTKLIALTHIPTYGGAVNPAAVVGRIARDVGAIYLVDACQSLGHLRLDVTELGCDFLTSAGRKYLRGPRGTGLLYVRNERMDQLKPICLDTRGMHWSAGGQVVVRDDARRFESWEASCVNKLGLGAAIDYTLAWGVDLTWPRIYALARRLTERLRQAEGVRLYGQGGAPCGVVSFQVDHGEALKVVRSLRERRINVSVTEGELAPLHPDGRSRDDLVRASVHYYNTVEEIDGFGDAVESVLTDDK